MEGKFDGRGKILELKILEKVQRILFKEFEEDKWDRSRKGSSVKEVYSVADPGPRTRGADCFTLLNYYYFLCNIKHNFFITTKKTKISEGYLVRENVKSLSNSVTKFCDQGICEEFYFFRH